MANESDKSTESLVFQYNWTLTPDARRKSKVLISPEFPQRDDYGLTWNLTISYQHTFPLLYEHFDVKLTLTSHNVQEANASFKLKIISSNKYNTISWTEPCNKLFNKNKRQYSFDTANLNGYVDRNSDTITVVCQITIPASEFYTIKNQNNSVIQFSEDLQTIFEKEEFSDITLSVKGKELKAHKVILAAGSSKFKAMFGNDMIKNRVRITNIKFEVLRELLRFIYTGKVSNLEQMAKELLVASHKYDLAKLKDMCETMLCKNVSTENVADMFIAADTYNAICLKEVAKKFIVDHSKEISGTSGWKSMILSHPRLLGEAFIALSEK